MTNTMKLYPRYDCECAFELDKLCEYITDGTIDSFIMNEFKRIDEHILGRFSINLTSPYNGLIIALLVDLNVIKNEIKEDVYKLRVEKVDSDGFIDIKTDIESIKKAINAIKCDNIPLHNISENIDVEMHDYILLDFI